MPVEALDWGGGVTCSPGALETCYSCPLGAGKAGRAPSSGHWEERVRDLGIYGDLFPLELETSRQFKAAPDCESMQMIRRVSKGAQRSCVPGAEETASVCSLWAPCPGMERMGWSVFIQWERELLRPSNLRCSWISSLPSSSAPLGLRSLALWPPL